MADPSASSRRGEAWVWTALALLLCVVALFRPVDHDESQYVAAAVLTAHGLLPYRDYAYLQTPLQPFLFAPIVWAAGTFAWPALRIANALLGALAIRCVGGAAREVADARAAAVATGLFGCCDILLFSIGTARNDALPAACLAGGLWLAVRAEREGATRAAAMLAGLLLAAAAAAKVSYALPAFTYGLWALYRRGHRPLFVALGAVPMLLFVGWTYLLSPEAFVFGVWTFPTQAPLDWYADRPCKLSLAAKLFDTLKFLTLGPALLALVAVARPRPPGLLVVLIAAGMVAALLPTPTWRQYLLPLLPPLFVALACAWGRQPPGRVVRIAAVVFAVAGLAPTTAALVAGKPAMMAAMRHGDAIRHAMDAADVDADAYVSTLSPQFLPATGRLPDPSLATGPFAFRSRLSFDEEHATLVLTRRTLDRLNGPAILVGGEGAWTSGDPALDAALERWAVAHLYRRVRIEGTPFLLYLRPPIQYDRPSGPA